MPKTKMGQERQYGQSPRPDSPVKPDELPLSDLDEWTRASIPTTRSGRDLQRRFLNAFLVRLRP